MPWLKALALPAVIAAMLLALWGMYQGLRQTQARLQTAEQSQAAHLLAINQLQKTATDNARDAGQLRALIIGTQADLTRKNQQWEQLKREHQDLKAWAESALPEPVGRLHQRPAITGAAGYQSWLQQGGGMHPAPGQPGP